MVFQRRVWEWARFCFGDAALEKRERSHRFVEEALELGQATGTTKEELLQLADYVYGRPAGVPFQEVGGTMTTLAVLCSVNGVDLEKASVAELDRCISKTDEIRAKSLRKPRGSPLPGSSEPSRCQICDGTGYDEDSKSGALCRNGCKPPSSKHVRGEWKVVRAGDVAVAQGYDCSCGVIGCRQLEREAAEEMKVGVTDESSAEIMDAFAALRCAMNREQESESIARVIEAVRADERKKLFSDGFRATRGLGPI